MSHPIVRRALAASCAVLMGFAPVGLASATDTADAGAAAAAAELGGNIAVAAAPEIEARIAAAAAARVAAAETARIDAEQARIADRAALLRPGEFVWEPGLALQGEVEMVVSIPLQRAYIYRGGTLIGVTTVSTGRTGHATPVGTFPILQKRREHYSNLYNNAPMPFMQRLTWDGIALHAGAIPGRPASHGCVRLPLAFARHLFAATELGAAVHIVDLSPRAGEALAMVRGNRAFAGMGGPLEDVSGGS